MITPTIELVKSLQSLSNLKQATNWRKINI